MSQTQKLKELLEDGKPHSTIEIMEKVYGGGHLGLARVGARIHDLRKTGMNIRGWSDTNNKTLYWYQSVNNLTSPPETCCISYHIFKVHERICPQISQIKNNIKTLF